MAPEQRHSKGKVTPRTDIYGLGAVLRALLPKRPPEVDAICRRCLAKDPAARYASAAELAAACTTCLNHISCVPHSLPRAARE